jgi:hypothetical protein
LDIVQILSIASSAAGVLSVGGALYSILLARRHSATLHNQIKQLDLIRDNLSTRYIGPFPDHMRAIVDGVRGAQRSIRIMCDAPAYAAYSTPQLYAEYKSALYAQRAKNTLLMTVI